VPLAVLCAARLVVVLVPAGQSRGAVGGGVQPRQQRQTTRAARARGGGGGGGGGGGRTRGREVVDAPQLQAPNLESETLNPKPLTLNPKP